MVKVSEKQPLLEEWSRDRDTRKQRFTACKDLGVLMVVYWLMYTAFTPTEMLQSSLNTESGLGKASLSIAASMNFLATMLQYKAIQLLKPKGILMFGCSMHMLYIAANLYPRWWTMLFAGMPLGLGGSLHWIGAGHYVTMVTKIYAETTGGDYNHLASLFQGIFFVGFALGGTTGGIIASLVLQEGSQTQTGNFTHDSILNTNTSFDALLNTNLTTINSCGIRGCPWNYDPEISSAPEETVRMLFLIFIAVDICAIILTATCLSNYEMNIGSVKESLLETIKKTFRELNDIKLLLLIHCCITGGALQTFFTADFTQV